MFCGFAIVSAVSAAASPGTLGWQLNNLKNLSHESGQGLFSVLDPGNFLARAAVPEGTQGITIEAGLFNHPVSKDEGWVAIGLGTPPDGKINILWPGGVFVLLNRNAEFECHYTDPQSGKVTKIRLAKIKDYSADRPTKFLLNIDLKAQTLTLHVNDKLVLDAYELANLPFDIRPRFVGVSGYAQKRDEPVVEYFDLKLEK